MLYHEFRKKKIISIKILSIKKGVHLNDPTEEAEGGKADTYI